MIAKLFIDGLINDKKRWNAINWRRVMKIVSRIQARIVKAVQRGDKKLVRALQRLLINSSLQIIGS